MTKRKTTTPEPTAAQTYAARAGDIARLIDVLQVHLKVHAEGAAAHPGDWGRAGDLGKVRGDLLDTVAFVSGMDREEVERFLNVAG